MVKMKNNSIRQYLAVAAAVAMMGTAPAPEKAIDRDRA
jgi:hypothetical protein